MGCELTRKSNLMIALWHRRWRVTFKGEARTRLRMQPGEF